MPAKYRKGFRNADGSDDANGANGNYDDDADDEAFATNAEQQMVCAGGGGTGAGDTADAQDRLEIIVAPFPLGGRPFSALNCQLVPQYFEQPHELFDEFGFRLPDLQAANGEQQMAVADPTAEVPPLETSTHRMRWLAMVQSTHSQVEEALVWAKVDVGKLRETPRFETMIQEQGIPHSLRPFLWPRLCGAIKKRKANALSYEKIVRKSEQESAPTVDVQIEKDLLRTLPDHYCFARAHRPGILPLRRVLRALAFLYPELGYCQGMGVVVASLLLVCCEEHTFWMMCCLIEDLLPASYYSPLLLGIRADQQLLNHLVQVHMPELTERVAHNADTAMVTVNWLITLLASAFPARVLFRIWDCFFTFGLATIFRIILAMFKFGENKLLLEQTGSAGNGSCTTAVFAAVSGIPSQIERVEDLLEMAESFRFSVTDHLIGELRRKYQGIVLAESGLLTNNGGANTGVPEPTKQKVTRRKLYRSKSIVRQLFERQTTKENSSSSSRKGNGGEESADDDDPKTKNIRQTELLLGLRNAIMQLCAHFRECTESEEHRQRQIRTQADYSIGFDAAKERELFMCGGGQSDDENNKSSSLTVRRARALTDFEQKDKDDLAFCKNDLILVVSDDRDEHCWVGELNGRRGWFPAKFVQLIDERGIDYCVRGDEMVFPRVGELVRGPLAFALRQILCHGIRSTERQLGGILLSSVPSHPWHFIELLAKVLVPMESNNKKLMSKKRMADIGNFSKLTLCNTFRLDKDGRMLSPEELLGVAIWAINRSHGPPANAPADAKLRSLVAFGLNEQCLHLWFDLFCHAVGQEHLRQRHFHSWSFIRSPVSQQIICELRLLVQFAFNLDINSEIVCVEEMQARQQSGTAAAANGAKSFVVAKNDRRSVDLPTVAAAAGAEGSRMEWERQGPLKEGVQDMLIKHHLFSWDI